MNYLFECFATNEHVILIFTPYIIQPKPESNTFFLSLIAAKNIIFPKTKFQNNIVEDRVYRKLYNTVFISLRANFSSLYIIKRKLLIFSDVRGIKNHQPLRKRKKNQCNFDTVIAKLILVYASLLLQIIIFYSQQICIYYKQNFWTFKAFFEIIY